MIELKNGSDNWIGNGEAFLYSLHPKQQKFKASNSSNKRMLCDSKYLAFGEEGFLIMF